MGLDGALVRFIPEHTENKNFNALRASYRFALSAALPIAIILGMVTFFCRGFFRNVV